MTFHQELLEIWNMVKKCNNQYDDQHFSFEPVIDESKSSTDHNYEGRNIPTKTLIGENSSCSFISLASYESIFEIENKDTKENNIMPPRQEKSWNSRALPDDDPSQIHYTYSITTITNNNRGHNLIEILNEDEIAELYREVESTLNYNLTEIECDGKNAEYLKRGYFAELYKGWQHYQQEYMHAMKEN